MRASGGVKRFAVWVVSDEYLDLYVLGVAALAFTILGFAGVAGVKVLASVTLALLALLAFSQIRSRRHLADLASVQRSDPLSVLGAEFPGDLDSRRGSASDLLLIGLSMNRTVQGGSLTVLRQMLRSGGRLRVLVVDPTQDVLVRAANAHRPNGPPDRLRRRIEATLEELAALRDITSGDVQLRVAPFIPPMGVNAFDVQGRDGLIVLQHYEHRPERESAPILVFRPSDGFWYQHFAAEAERLWNDGVPWPLSTDEVIRRSARPAATREFGPELNLSMSSARELLITGVTRNALIISRYGQLEDWLRKGCKIRILLTEPASPAAAVAAERYYAERSPDSVRDRVRHSLRLLAELERATAGDLTVRLTSYPIAVGVIAADARPDSRSAATTLFAEYYTYRARDEPKFILQPADGLWFENLYQEAEALWDTADDLDLASPPGSR